MLLARHDAARFAAHGTHAVEHYFGPSEKPWVRAIDERFWDDDNPGTDRPRTARGTPSRRGRKHCPNDKAGGCYYWHTPTCPLLRYLPRLPLAEAEGSAAADVNATLLAASPCVAAMRQARERLAARLQNAAKKAELPPFPLCARLCDVDTYPVASFWGFQVW